MKSKGFVSNTHKRDRTGKLPAIHRYAPPALSEKKLKKLFPKSYRKHSKLLSLSPVHDRNNALEALTMNRTSYREKIRKDQNDKHQSEINTARLKNTNNLMKSTMEEEYIIDREGFELTEAKARELCDRTYDIKPYEIKKLKDALRTDNELSQMFSHIIPGQEGQMLKQLDHIGLSKSKLGNISQSSIGRADLTRFTEQSELALRNESF